MVNVLWTSAAADAEVDKLQKRATVFVVHVELPKIQNDVLQAIVEEARCSHASTLATPLTLQCSACVDPSTLWSAEPRHPARVSCNLNIEFVSLLMLCSTNWKTSQTPYLDKLKPDGCVGQVLPRTTTLVRRPFLHSGHILVVLCKLWKQCCGSKACDSGETAAALCKPGLSYFGPQCRAQLLGGDWFVGC